jgi:hypothetical protein
MQYTATEGPLPPWETQEGYNGRPEDRRPRFTDPAWMLKRVQQGQQRMRIIALFDVQSSSAAVTGNESYELLCSYSWKNTEGPTIYVPGTPSLYRVPQLPMQLQADMGFFWMDQHGKPSLEYSFEPIFQAMAVMNPTKRWNDIDVLVNRSSLQKLFDFASFKRNHRPFCLEFQVVGTTLLIGRREKSPKIFQKKGCGHNFEDSFTSADPNLEDVDGHHRVIQYQMGNLQLAVRLEADAYLQDIEPAFEAGDNYDLQEFFGNVMHIFEPARHVAIAHSNNTHTFVVEGGTYQPHNSTMELKSNYKKPHAKEQCWFGRTSLAVFGHHHRNRITAVEEVRWFKKDFETWAEEHQRQLKRLVWLLEELRRVVEGAPGQKAVLVAIETGAPLQIFEMKDEKGLLPREIIERFWDDVSV